MDEDTLEAAVMAETGMKTPLIKYNLDEFVERVKRDLPTYHEEAPEGDNPEAPAAADVTMAPAEVLAATDITMAPADIVMAPAEAHAPADEISDAQAFLRERFEAAKLTAAPTRRGRPNSPIVCIGCKKEFRTPDDNYNHVRRGKCILCKS